MRHDLTPRARAAAALSAATIALPGCGNAAEQPPATFVPKEGNSAGPPRIIDPQPQPGDARAIFARACGTCHTMAAAQSEGFVGPDLDELRPSAARVRAAIRNGGALNKIMPSNLLDARDTRRVARYVARAAG